MSEEEDVAKRLRQAADSCLSNYETWSGNKKDGDAREGLLEAVHELRRVASRLEIELAMSERDEMAKKPIPIPPHRDANRRSQESDDVGNRPDSGSGSNNNSHGSRRGPRSNNNKRRSSNNKKASSQN